MCNWTDILEKKVDSSAISSSVIERCKESKLRKDRILFVPSADDI